MTEAPDKPQALRFVRRGQVVELNHVPADRTLLQVLREDLHCTGTKEGCGEGDCGACTVVVGQNTVNAAGEQHIEYRAINSCIRLAHSVDGQALWTVEDLTRDPLIEPAPTADALHPVQEALVKCHASQCGFCTPGFVMSLFALYQSRVVQGQAITREVAQEALSGNLCRCTGYRPILDAALCMDDEPVARVNERALRQQLAQLQAPMAACDTAHATGHTPQANNYHMPTTLAQLLQARAADPQAQLVAGCTDASLWVTKQLRQFARVIDLTRVAELRCVEHYPHHIAIGAAATLTDAFAALVTQRPQLARFAQRFAALPVRNSGTLGGNVANGSPIGDSMPLLLALGASVVLMRWQTRPGGKGAIAHRELLLQDFYTGYRQNVMQPDEVLAWIKVPHPSEAELLRAYKVSKRFEDDISAVCLVICLELDQGRVAQARIGAGGVAATPARARQTEAALQGQPWTQETAQRAAQVLAQEFSPISDMRASAAYRRQVLGQLMQRFWLESQGHSLISVDTLSLEAL